jgi:hypothetical protein
MARPLHGLAYADLVLIYQKSDTDTLRLVRLGSHAELIERFRFMRRRSLPRWGRDGVGASGGSNSGGLIEVASPHPSLPPAGEGAGHARRKKARHVHA